MSNKQEANKFGCEYEEEFGSVDFIKVCLNVCTRLLVEKGIATEEELRQRFIDEIKTTRQSKIDKTMKQSEDKKEES